MEVTINYKVVILLSSINICDINYGTCTCYRFFDRTKRNITPISMSTFDMHEVGHDLTQISSFRNYHKLIVQ